jgi:hypothetical protein
LREGLGRVFFFFFFFFFWFAEKKKTLTLPPLRGGPSLSRKRERVPVRANR